LEHGMVDLVVPRAKLRETLVRLIGLLRRLTPPAEIVTLPTAEGAAGLAQEAPAG
jgi:acetyl-CoA carboxylase beta subunit